jgi:AcrR family transcriptional regulator
MVIRQALLDLMKQNPINKITVTEICARAEINRGTFYAYYTDVFDLMAQIENALFSEVNNAIQNSLQTGTTSDMLAEILDYIAQNNDLCKVLLGPNGDMDFVRRLVNIGHEKTIAEWRLARPEAEIEALELLNVFICNGTVGILENWIVNDTRQSPKEIAQFIADLISRCLA